MQQSESGIVIFVRYSGISRSVRVQQVLIKWTKAHNRDTKVHVNAEGNIFTSRT